LLRKTPRLDTRVDNPPEFAAGDSPLRKTPCLDNPPEFAQQTPFSSPQRGLETDCPLSIEQLPQARFFVKQR
jgi:hypothetical protein